MADQFPRRAVLSGGTELRGWEIACLPTWARPCSSLCSHARSDDRRLQQAGASFFAQPMAVAAEELRSPWAQLASNDARCRCLAIHALASVAVANGLTVIGWLSEVMTSTENPSLTGITQ